MNVLVTGANGFIGRHLVTALCKNGYEVRVASRKKEGFSTANVEVKYCDLLDVNNSLDEVVSGCSIIFHCAGELRNESMMRPLHVDATNRLLSAAVREVKSTGRKIHWVQLSSVGVYGPPTTGKADSRVVTEACPERPVGEYETTKADSDKSLLAMSDTPGFSYSIVRPSNVIGADMPNDSVRALGNMVRRGLFFYIGKKGAIATYVHVDDVIDVMLLCATDPKASGEVFNVSNDCLFEEVIESMANAFSVSSPRVRMPEYLLRAVVCLMGKVIKLPITNERINALVSRTRYPTDKLKVVLGFQPKVNVVDAIGEIVACTEAK